MCVGLPVLFQLTALNIDHFTLNHGGFCADIMCIIHDTKTNEPMLTRKALLARQTYSANLLTYLEFFNGLMGDTVFNPDLLSILCLWFRK